jgi:hypothetical protein
MQALPQLNRGFGSAGKKRQRESSAEEAYDFASSHIGYDREVAVK